MTTLDPAQALEAAKKALLSCIREARDAQLEGTAETLEKAHASLGTPKTAGPVRAALKKVLEALDAEVKHRIRAGGKGRLERHARRRVRAGAEILSTASADVYFHLESLGADTAQNGAAS